MRGRKANQPHNTFHHVYAGGVVREVSAACVCIAVMT